MSSNSNFGAGKEQIMRNESFKPANLNGRQLERKLDKS